jgi:protein MPE1
MASSVFYKFKSQREDSRVTFDGTGISVFDLKRDIILANNLGKANDFDLFVSDSSTGQEYKDDSQIIPRSSSVIVRRLPSVRPGKGKAAMYIAGTGGPSTGEPLSKHGGPINSAPSWHKGAMSKRFDGKEEPTSKPSLNPVNIKPSAITNDEEAAAMAAMFQAQTANWEETQEKMTQLVSHPCGFVLCSRLNSHERDLFPPPLPVLRI